MLFLGDNQPLQFQSYINDLIFRIVNSKIIILNRAQVIGLINREKKQAVRRQINYNNI